MGFQNSKLKKATLENTPEWNLGTKPCLVKVLKVYDGDTIWVAIKLKGSIFKIKVRLYGIDTPEMKPSRSKLNRDEEIKKAKEARDYLASLINNKIIILKSEGFGKYGRVLGKLYLKRGFFCKKTYFDVNKEMINKGYATEYYGGEKTLNT